MASSDLAVLIQTSCIHIFFWRDKFLYSFRFFCDDCGTYAFAFLDVIQCSGHFIFFLHFFFCPGNCSRTGSIFISKISCYFGARSTCSIKLWDLYRCTCTFISVALLVGEMMGLWNFIHYQHAWFSNLAHWNVGSHNLYTWQKHCIFCHTTCDYCNYDFPL